MLHVAVPLISILPRFMKLSDSQRSGIFRCLVSCPKIAGMESTHGEHASPHLARCRTLFHDTDTRNLK